MRKKYLIRFAFRLLILAMVAVLYFAAPDSFNIMGGFAFFDRLTLLHLPWLIWMLDMLLQLIPTKNYLTIGSQKVFLRHFRPISNQQKLAQLYKFVKNSNFAALKMLVVWLLLLAVIAALYFSGLLKQRELLLIATVFYVCDLVCVLFWCPFQKWLLKNRCCATCRIFNWDHLMMFSPLAFAPGFYCWSLVAVSVIVLVAWELSFFIHPERFWEGTNAALTCANCEEQLCGGKYCYDKATQ